ncbi:hypothetical protein CJF30_00011371 [Rutstroemia sp. NJR-2017a BBW]|nr:hypothetical protein CJF30_00011371 [Rutstroemia sp. NJR-2017a BBW]
MPKSDLGWNGVGTPAQANCGAHKCLASSESGCETIGKSISTYCMKTLWTIRLTSNSYSMTKISANPGYTSVSLDDVSMNLTLASKTTSSNGRCFERHILQRILKKTRETSLRTKIHLPPLIK